MKLKFKSQPYQTAAVESVLDCFAGQPRGGNSRYRIDPGAGAATQLELDDGFRNDDLALSDEQLLKNVQDVQRRQNLLVSKGLRDFYTFRNNGTARPAQASYNPGAALNLDIEMETGTGKTYCYIKTMFEMNKRHGWSKFIVMVPSIAIREGVAKSFEITADHFAEAYGKKARFFIYSSDNLHELENFSSDSGIYVMIVNRQAFTSAAEANLRIYRELDDFQSRRPIDVIAANRPILILDEPQKMEGAAVLEALPKFKPLFIVRYSATHKTNHLKVHRLDAVDAYNQKLVKKIAVRGIKVTGHTGTNAYLDLINIEISKASPVARVEMEIKSGSGIRRDIRKLAAGDDLLVTSGGLEAYRGYVVSDIRYLDNVVEFKNGAKAVIGEPLGNILEEDFRRIQIRETIRAHLQKERHLFTQGIKVLSLLFIDEVAKYRDYSNETDTRGPYARMFEDQYAIERDAVLSELPLGDDLYRNHLSAISPGQTHNGYFSIDKKTKKFVDSSESRDSGSDDVDAYDLILKDKERLLSFDEPTRFIFSHSALREGWDNPNVFVMGMLKSSQNITSRRQEVGRGLRLCVDSSGNRVDDPATVHDTNVLTVVASESYQDFVGKLQQEMVEELSARPRKANEAYFIGKQLTNETGSITVDATLAKALYRYLLKNEYTDDQDHIADAYHEAKSSQTLAPLPPALEPYATTVFALVDSVFSDAQLPRFENANSRKRNPLNANFDKKEFQELWRRINAKAVYRVEFDSGELVTKAASALNSLRVQKLRYLVQGGTLVETLAAEQLEHGTGFQTAEQEYLDGAVAKSSVKYDLIGEIAEQADITRRTVVAILKAMQPAIYAQFQNNPVQFMSEASRLITEQKASMVIEKLTYDPSGETYDTEIFTRAQTDQDFSQAIGKLNRHIYDYVVTQSGTETRFVQDLDTQAGVVVYAKLPRGFTIPTPVGDYNPDWAVAFQEGDVRHIYFVAETKGVMSSLALRGIERAKIDCAEKFFAVLATREATFPIKYGKVKSFSELLDIVRP